MYTTFFILFNSSLFSNNMKTNAVTTNSSMGFSPIHVESIWSVDVNGTKGRLTITTVSRIIL